jgi:glycogen operon protein
MVGAVMQRLYGSDDLFPDGPGDVYRPYQSVNYVTAHDGFCLYDLVAYNEKHNDANGHGNTDGTSDNRSWNCGWEGDDDAPTDVIALRKQQVKNFFTLLMLANGTPMFCAGDEFLNTQRGNNNPYNQDNETTWLDWSLLEKNRDMFRFFQYMIAFRKARPWIGRSRYWRDDVRWYGAHGQADLSHESRTLAYSLGGGNPLYIMINAFWEPVVCRIQEGGQWTRLVDTSREGLLDEAVSSVEYKVQPRSIVILESKK